MTILQVIGWGYIGIAILYYVYLLLRWACRRWYDYRVNLRFYKAMARSRRASRYYRLN